MGTEESLSYSIEALRVKALFYGKRSMVYVEGPDDVPFWDVFFDRTIFEIENVGGSQNLRPYISKLENGEMSFIVACDSDYSSVCGISFHSPLIVTTYGHSIENMMYCPYNLNEAIKKLSRTSIDSVDAINEWYDNFTKAAMPLLEREIVNIIYNPKEDKIPALGLNCAQYCKTQPCYELDDNKIAKYCDDNKSYYPESELTKARGLIQSYKRGARQLIRGHFYTYAVARLVTALASMNSSTARCTNLSHEWLFSITVHCDRCCVLECIEKEYIENQVNRAIESLIVA